MVETKGASEISIKTTKHKKKHSTVNLCVLKDGTKLPPLIILDRKAYNPKSKLVVTDNEPSWMNH